MSTNSAQISQQAFQSLLEKLNSSQEGSDGQNHSELVLRSILDSQKFSEKNESEITAAVEEYIKGKPLAYITGQHTFGNLDLTIRPPVYIPRVETEQWVLLLAQEILSKLPSSDGPIRILDICSGSGCIPLLLAKQGKGRIHTVGLEYDEGTLSVARENIKRNHLEDVSSFEQFDIFQNTTELQKKIGKFDMVISNPPYVSSVDMKEVEGKWFEGKLALQGKLNSSTDESKVQDDDDGYSFYRRILELYSDFLSPSRSNTMPKLVLEVGSKQSQVVQDIYKGQGRIEVHKESQRRLDISTPKLEAGDPVGTERSLWIYEEK